MNSIRPSWRTLTATALLATVAVAGPLHSRQAHAQIVSCRSDPVISLSNLGQLDVSANISDSESDVQNISYVVHVPVGTQVLAVTSTDGLIGLKESVHVYADAAANTFDVYTTVYTGQGHVPVQASSTAVSSLNLVLGSASASGYSGQSLHTHFSSLL